VTLSGCRPNEDSGGKSLEAGYRGSSAPALVVENLSFKYRERPDYALRDVSFELEAGQIMLVAGTSGCGKTTLIRCVNGLIPRSYRGELEGRIYLRGEATDDKSLAAISQMVGTVLQDPERQILGSRVANEVAFGPENLGLPPVQITARVDETLDYLGINHLRRRETFYLSGGEKQKVALAGILAMQPSILLLDEPLASLDPASAQEALRLIRRLADEGRAILIVEHRVEDILKIRPEKALFLMGGQLQYLGPAAGLERVVDYHEVKLPAPMIISRARHDQAPVYSPPLLTQAEEVGETLVDFEEVSFAYEEGPLVLHDVNLTIHRGDIIAVLGPNGAGKTTLVKHAIGLLKPTAGRVLVEGVDTHELSVAEIAKTLGYVFQSPSHMLFAPTVRKELAFGPENLGYDETTIDGSVSEAVRILNLSGLEEYPPLALSFGQQKRVSIAAIMSMRSRVLVMDEPTAGQDYKNYMVFMDAILQLPNFEAILFITHDIDLAVCYANRVVLVYEGRIAADGPPQEVLAQYDLLERCHIVPTSLLAANLERLPQTGRFMRAEALAHV
jgi:energy-coupling factor transporter ATP-binding protein EcfA2